MTFASVNWEEGSQAASATLCTLFVHPPLFEESNADALFHLHIARNARLLFSGLFGSHWQMECYFTSQKIFFRQGKMSPNSLLREEEREVVKYSASFCRARTSGMICIYVKTRASKLDVCDCSEIIHAQNNSQVHHGSIMKGWLE